MMFYLWKLRLFKNSAINYVWRYWQAWRGNCVGNYSDLPAYIKEYAPGSSFVDVGSMWGVDGRYAFIAEKAGATSVKAVDIYGPTPEFEQEAAEHNSSVEFILGDITSLETLAKIGNVDVVFCAGVLYHHPNPYELLVALRRICNKTLILRTFAIPEIKGLANAAIFFPHLAQKDRQIWDLASLGLANQPGISDAFDLADGYSNYFWGMTPSCLRSLLKTAGFNVQVQAIEAFAQTFVCEPADVPFEHMLKDAEQARKIAAKISSRGEARPA